MANTKKEIKDVVFSCPDWDARLEAGVFPLDVDQYLPYMNDKRSDQMLQIISRMRIPDLAGQPLRVGEYFPEWQQTIAALIAGGLQPNGEQLIKTALISVPKKNDKSSFSACIMLALAMMSPRPNAEFLIVAPTQSISEISFKQMVGIIQADPQLAKLWHIQSHIKRCTFLPNKCTTQIKTLDPTVLTGTKAAGVLVDEGFLLSTTESSRIMTQVKGAGAAIKEQQTIIISTMSDKPASGWWKQELQLARDVRDGKTQVPGILPLIWEPSPEQMTDIANVCKPEVWRRCNPNLDRSVSLDWLKQSFKSVLASGDEVELKRWLSQHTNCEISTLLGGNNTWPGIAHWSKAADKAVNFDWIRNHCSRIALGFDGGGSHDLTSLSMVGIDNDDSNKIYVYTKSWCYQELMSQDRGHLGDAIKDGDLEVIYPGEEIEFVSNLALDIYNDNPVDFLGVACDPAGIAAELSHALVDAGVSQDKIIAVKQGFAIKPAWVSMFRKLSAGQMFHGDQELLNWAVSNCQLNDGGFCSKKSALEKIDPIVSIAAAVMLIQNPPESWNVDALIA